LAAAPIFFSLGVGFSAASHIPVETAQYKANSSTIFMGTLPVTNCCSSWPPGFAPSPELGI